MNSSVLSSIPSVFWLCLACLHGMLAEINAAPITYTFKGTGSGVFGGVPFSSAQFTVSLFGDSTNVSELGGGVCSVDGWASAVGVRGAGYGTFTTTKRVFASGASLGFSRGMTDGGFDLLNVQHASFAGYDLRSSFGLIGNLSPSAGTAAFSELTTVGLISFSSMSGISFKAETGDPAPPQILAQPTNHTVVAGSAVMMGVSVAGVEPLAIQWRQNGTNLPTGMDIPLVLTNVQTGNAGDYFVVVTNLFGATTSQVATVSVIPSLPVVTQQPLSQAVMTGATVNFSSTALGSEPLVWQWYLNGNPVPSGNSSKLTLTNVQTTAFGNYWVVVTNSLGGATSSVARLNFSPVITWGRVSGSLPWDATNVIALAGGDDHQVALRSEGSVFAWGANHSGQTNVPPDATNVESIAAGSWHSLAVRADGTIKLWGRIIGSGVTNVPPEATNVVAVALGPGAQHALALRADGGVIGWGSAGGYTPLLTNIPPTVTNIVQVAAGSFHSLALRSDGKVISWGEQTTVPNSATNIVAIAAGWRHNAALRADGRVVTWGIGNPPASATNIIDLACGGGHVMALRRDGRVVVWGDNSQGQLNIPATATNLATVAGGSYASMAVVAEGPPAFQTPAIARTVAIGANAFFRMAAVGARPLSYQWRANGTNLPGATNSVLALTNVQPSFAGPYSVIVSNSLGIITSSDMMLTTIPLEITISPPNRSAVVGTSVVFTANVIGQGPLSYQWRFNGGALAGATNNSLILTNLQMNHAGEYSVDASNAYGSVTSRAATLEVIPLVITSHPQSQSVLAGTNVTFGVSAAGVEPFRYQWQVNQVDLVGETNVVLTLTNVTLNKAGGYRVIVSNDFAVVTSSNASLVVSPLLITQQPSNVSTILGGNATFGVTAVGEGPFSYQWRLSGTNLPAATENPLVLTNLHLREGGLFSAVISNSYGSVTSSAATLSISQVAVWGDGGSGQLNLPGGLTNVVAISAGYYHTLALKKDGKAVVWGSTWDQTVPTNLANVTAIAAGGFHNLALKADGTITTWGSGFYGSTVLPNGLTNVVAIAAGEYFSMALKSDGTVLAWGAGSTNSGVHPEWGQAVVPVGLTNVVAIAAGGAHALALHADGTIEIWGRFTNQPPDLTNVVAIAAGYLHSVVLRSDGTVVVWGDNGFGQTELPSGLTNVLAITAGNWNSLALSADDRLVVWSRNDMGQTNVPPGLRNIQAIAGGNFHMAALLAEEPRVLHASLIAPALGIDGFKVSLPTQSGRVYRLEYKTSLLDDHWSTLPLAGGNGGMLTLADPTPTNSVRFYRVRQW